MKMRILIGLCAIAIAGSVSTRAEDTPEQAAARAALEQAFFQLDHPQASKTTDTNTVAATNPARHATNKVSPVATKGVAAEPATAKSLSAIPSRDEDSTAGASATQAATGDDMFRMGDQEIRSLPANPGNTERTAPSTAEDTTTAPSAPTPAAVASAEVAPATTPIVAPPAAVPSSSVAAPAPTTLEKNSSQPALAAQIQAPTTGITSPAPAQPVAATVETHSAATTIFSKPALILHAATLSAAHPAPTSSRLVTADGSVYRNAHVERIMSDGIVISYTPADGGIGMTKLSFSDLTPEMRQRYQNN